MMGSSHVVNPASWGSVSLILLNLTIPNPGSVPEPRVGTMSISKTSFAKTFRVAAPVGFSVQTFGSLTRRVSHTPMGTSVNAIR
jgi:hypothetical protein